MKILLLNPPFPLFPSESKFASPPLGLAYIAAVLQVAGHDVRILDSVVEGYSTEIPSQGDLKIYGLRNEEIIKRIKDFGPQVIGISCVFSTLHNIVIALSTSIKEAFPEIKIVLGGTHATVFAEELIVNPAVDFIIKGEGEYAMAGLLDYLSGRISLEEVDNLVWKHGGLIKSNPQKFIQDIDKLPFPARHLLNMAAYKKIGLLQGLTRPGVSATTVITSRGCPASCIFCSIHSVWGHKFRAHSADYVLNELEYLKDGFGIKHVLFEDDNLTYDKRRAESIFSGIIKRKFEFTWTAPNGIAVWCLDEVLLKLIKNSGCSNLFLAIESGDPETLKNIIHKPLSLEKTTEVIEICYRLGIRTQAFFVVGLPGETMSSMHKSMAFAKRLNVDRISIAIATPYPGTKLYDICKENGYLNKNFNVTKLITRTGQIHTSEFCAFDVEKLVSITYLGFSVFHPIKTIKRLIERIQADWRQTLYFIFRRSILLIK